MVGCFNYSCLLEISFLDIVFVIYPVFSFHLALIGNYTLYSNDIPTCNLFSRSFVSKSLNLLQFTKHYKFLEKH